MLKIMLVYIFICSHVKKTLCPIDKYLDHSLGILFVQKIKKLTEVGVVGNSFIGSL